MVLRLVPPPGTPSPNGRRGCPSPALSLTDDEDRHLRASIRNIARSYGSTQQLARALGLCHSALSVRRKRLSAAVAVALWRLTGVPLDVLLRGKLAAVSSPPRGPEHAA
jgi:hypothetical protein